MVTLRLKVIDHYGVAIRSKVSGFDELSGVDVIVLHRLLKNDVNGSEYTLLTEPAYRFLKPSLRIRRSHRALRRYRGNFIVVPLAPRRLTSRSPENLFPQGCFPKARVRHPVPHD